MALRRFVSKPIALTFRRDAEFRRADLTFYGVDHSGSSYEGRVFFNNPDAGDDTPRDAEHGYAGSFYVFGHGGCYGDEGHCDVPSGPRSPYDLRLPHQLIPLRKTMVVTEPIKRLRDGGATSFTVTVVPIPSRSPVPVDDNVLDFKQLSLLVYD